MKIGELNKPAELAVRVATAQQSYTATLSARKDLQTTASPATDQYRSASQTIIEAEYVDLYNPIRPPPGQQDQWRNLIVEEKGAPKPQAAGYSANERNQQLMTRYGQSSSDLPLPGSFVNIFT